MQEKHTSSIGNCYPDLRVNKKKKHFKVQATKSHKGVGDPGPARTQNPGDPSLGCSLGSLRLGPGSARIHSTKIGAEKNKLELIGRKVIRKITKISSLHFERSPV